MENVSSKAILVNWLLCKLRRLAGIVGRKKIGWSNGPDLTKKKVNKKVTICIGNFGKRGDLCSSRSLDQSLMLPWSGGKKREVCFKKKRKFTNIITSPFEYSHQAAPYRDPHPHQGPSIIT